MKLCRSAGCSRPVFRKLNYCLLCKQYFDKSRKLGWYGYVKFTNQIEVTETCWLWKGILTPGGYGLFRTKVGKVEVAHRASYQHYVGLIPQGLQLDHLCRNRGCVNPKHLEPVTAVENAARKPKREELK